MKQTFVLQPEPHQARVRVMGAIRTAPDGYVVQISEASRTLSQNAAQWPILEAFSRQLTWPINGERVKMEPDDWKDVLTATFRGEQARISQTLDGRVVMLGQRTRDFVKSEFSDWLEFLHATAAVRGIELTEQAA